MVEWKAKKKDLKSYPHFDTLLSLEELEKIANDPVRVAQNPFFPFLRYHDTHTPFRPLGNAPKVRQIRYAARQDAAIFSRYRFELSIHYEALLEKLGLSDCVLAYRSIPVQPGSSVGKSNISHAKAAFDLIRQHDECCAITLDISSYFEHVDHSRIKEVWCRLLGVMELPEDHYSVFKAITKYAIVDTKEAYTALGYFGMKPLGRVGYLKAKKDMPKQLCSPEEFRAKVCGKANGYRNLIEKNKETFGIPQGAPLSDLLANAYLIDFDVEMLEYANAHGGYYMRYSDDILFIIPVKGDEAKKIMSYVQSRIEAYGEHLQIKETKCTIDRFTRSGSGFEHEAIYPDGKSRNGLNYLGFRFDGRRVYLRDSTVSNFRRKISRAVNSEARKVVQRYPGKDISFLDKKLNTDLVIEKFGRVREFTLGDDKRSWTFWTYVDRANKAFGSEARFYQQISNYKKAIRSLASKALVKWYLRSF